MESYTEIFTAHIILLSQISHSDFNQSKFRFDHLAVLLLIAIKNDATPYITSKEISILVQFYACSLGKLKTMRSLTR